MTDSSTSSLRGRVREGGDSPGPWTTALALLPLFTLFFIGGALVWWLMDGISRTDISGDGWSLRGNGALIVPVVFGPALMAAGWGGLAIWARGESSGFAAALLAGAVAILLAGLAGFAPVLWPGIPIPLLTLGLALGAGLGLAALFGRPRRTTYVVSAAVFALALVLGELAGGSVALVAPLIVPLLIALPLFRTGSRHEEAAPAPGAGWRVAAYFAVPVGVMGGFIAANIYVPPLLAAGETARSQHTATLVADGRVLVVGGSGDHGRLATAYLFDPEIGHWSQMPSMAVARAGHTATLLRDRRVLLVGGDCCTRPGGVQVFDPMTFTWSDAAPTPTSWIDHRAVRLGDGRVLVDGGFNADSANAPPWLYDPATDKWTLAGGGSEVRPRLFALPDGRALALAGQYGTNNVRIGVSIFDPRAGTWVLGRLGPEWPTANFAHLVAGATLGDGRILALGGQLEPGGAIVATVFDPSSITWSPTAAPSNPPYEGATLTVLQDGRVLLAGGTVLSDSPPRGGPTAHAELYDPDRGTWSPTADMVSPRSGHTATLLRDGRVLVVGGITRAGALATAELYDPRTGAWQPTSSIGS